MPAFSFTTRGIQKLGIDASHAENAKRVESSHFLKEISVTNQGWLELDSVSAQKGAPEARRRRLGPLPQPGMEDGPGLPRQSWV